MKNLLFTFFCLALMALGSCSKPSSEELLKTVPATTRFLAVVNQEKLSASLNSKESLSLVASSLDRITSQRGGASGPSKWTAILDGESGIDTECRIVVFEYKNATLFTFMVKDAGKFRDHLASKAGTALVENKGVWCDGGNTVFMKGNQAWITSGYPTLHSTDILLLCSLKDSESILTLSTVAEMADSDNDIDYICNLAEMSKWDMINPQTALAYNLAFEDVVYASGFMNFLQAHAEGEMNLLNSQGQPARRALSLSKINMNAINSFNGKGNVFFATSLDPKVVGMVVDQLKNMPFMPEEYITTLQQIDGTIVFSTNLNEIANNTPDFSMAISFGSPEAAQQNLETVKSFLPSISPEATATAEANMIMLKSGQQEGSSISSFKKEFEGSNLTLVYLPSSSPDEKPVADNIKQLTLRETDNGESAKFTIRIDTKGQNSLNALLRL